MKRFELLVMSFSALAFACFLCCSAGGNQYDNKQKRLDYISGTAQSVLYRELEQSFFKRFFEPNVRKLQKSFEKITEKKKTNKKDEKKATVERQLRLAGIFIDVGEFNFYKIIVLIVSVVV